MPEQYELRLLADYLGGAQAVNTWQHPTPAAVNGEIETDERGEVVFAETWSPVTPAGVEEDDPTIAERRERRRAGRGAAGVSIAGGGLAGAIRQEYGAARRRELGQELFDVARRAMESAKALPDMTGSEAAPTETARFTTEVVQAVDQRRAALRAKGGREADVAGRSYSAGEAAAQASPEYKSLEALARAGRAAADAGDRAGVERVIGDINKVGAGGMTAGTSHPTPEAVKARLRALAYRVSKGTQTDATAARDEANALIRAQGAGGASAASYFRETLRAVGTTPATQRGTP